MENTSGQKQKIIGYLVQTFRRLTTAHPLICTVDGTFSCPDLHFLAEHAEPFAELLIKWLDEQNSDLGKRFGVRRHLETAEKTFEGDVFAREKIVRSLVEAHKEAENEFGNNIDAPNIASCGIRAIDAPCAPEETDALVKSYVDGTKPFKSGGTTADSHRRLIFSPDD